MQNLSGQIESAEKALLRSPAQTEFISTLVTLLEIRAQFLGRLVDYERAEQLVARWVQLTPSDPSAQLARATIRSILHQFPGALDDLAQAERLGGSALAVSRSRAVILQAQGHLGDALAIWQGVRDLSPDIISLGLVAIAHAEAGNLTEAERLLDQALGGYRDVSPFPVAWIVFQRGLIWERAGEKARAKAQFQLAHQRLPQYAAATGRLAAALEADGESTLAVALLERLTRSSDDPEYIAQLAALRITQGNLSEAARLRAEASQRYTQLIQRHPAAFAEHAARFWLSEDPKKALILAQRNLEVRSTPEAYELAIASALAAHEPTIACGLADQARSLPRAPATLLPLVNQALPACGGPVDASRISPNP